MSKRDLVNRAIRECLQRCYSSNHILATIENFVDELRRTNRWAEGDLRAVERGVRQVLYAILKDGSSAGNEPDSDHDDRATNGSGAHRIVE